ncbi:MAG: PAS domain S-box protein [Pseudomonadota bacterium]
METKTEIHALKARIRELEAMLADLGTGGQEPGSLCRTSAGMSSRFLRLMADTVPDLIWAKDMQDRFIFANKAMCRHLIMCDTTDEPLGKTDIFFALREKSRGFHHTFGEICVNSDQMVKDTNQPGRFVEEGYVRGQYLVLDVHKAPLFDENGAMIGTVGCARDITQEKEFEKKLMYSHEQFTTVLDNLDSAVYVADMDTHEILFVNRTAADYAKSHPSWLVGKICWQVFQKDQKGPCSFCNNPRLLDENGNPNGVHIGESHNTLFNRTFETHDQAIQWPDGRIVRLEIATDITKQNQAMAALKKSEERFRKMADLLPIPIGEYDFDYTVFYSNRAGLDWFGYRGGGKNGKVKVTDLIPGEDSLLLEKLTLAVRQGQDPGPVEMRFIKQDGSELYGQIYLAPIKDQEEIIGVRACFQDLTERRKVEAALRESEKKYRTLFNGLDDAIMVHPFVDEGFKPFVEVNDVACSRYGYTREEFRHMTPMDICRSGNAARHATCEARQALMAAGRKTMEVVHMDASGRTFPVEVTSSIFDFYGRAMILSAARDITDRKRSEQDRADALKFAAEQEKYALVGQVAGKMAHDFNNILMAIMGHAEISILDCRDDQILESLNIILEQTRRGRVLTQNLVAFAKDQEPREEFFNVNEKIDLVINLLRKELKSINLIRGFNFDIPDLLADPGMIEHVLVNLIQNAIHAMSLTPDPVLTIRTHSDGRNLFIDIVDNGCGIPPRHLKEIFTPSFTLKGSRDTIGAYSPGIKGTGYGMANVKKYIEKHNGAISVDSAPGQGTRITLSIPLMNRDLTPGEQAALSHQILVREKRVLLVEDEPAIAAILLRILGSEPFHHDVVVAHDGDKALDAFENQDFDIISLDYLLPGGMTGLDVYRHIRKHNTRVPILFVSGNIEFLESMKDLKALDPNLDYLSKPCSNMAYVRKINQQLQQP